MKPGIWKNKKRTITGRWEYIWSSDRFVILLDSVDRITGSQRKLVIGGDSPEWGNWKLQPDKPKNP